MAIKFYSQYNLIRQQWKVLKFEINFIQVMIKRDNQCGVKECDLA